MKTRMRLFGWMAGMCLMAAGASAQKTIVKGVVMDSLTLEGEPFATIRIYKQGDREKPVAMNVTDMDGLFEQEVKGKGAIVTTVLSDNEFAINVIGNDYLVNEDSFTTYTVTFKSNTVDAIGSISADNAKNHKVYTLDGVRVSGKPAAGVYVVDGKKTTIK